MSKIIAAKNITKKALSKVSRPIRKITHRHAPALTIDEKNNLINRLNEMQDQITDLKAQLINAETYTTTIAHELGDFEAETKYIYYYHGGSGNHGCEALVRTITGICNIQPDELGLYSCYPEEDREFGILDIARFIKKSHLNTNEMIIKYNPKTIAFSIGGDNYCGYPIPNLAEYNRKFHAAGAKTALIGCSIEPDNLRHGEILGDLCQFDLITARESITYNALIENGITKNTHLVPDSAFTLQPIPSGITLPKHTVGINLSDIIFSTNDKSIFNNAVNLISYILEKTNYHIALIPHVHQVLNDNNDQVVLKRLWQHFNQDPRIHFIDTTFNACQIKDIVGQCQLLVAARTHCSIAGYSIKIPTLVLGYSVKSKGIAKDLFGTDEHYVKSVYNLKSDHEFRDAFIWLDQNQSTVKKQLEKAIPPYTTRAKELQPIVKKLASAVQTPQLPQSIPFKKGHYQKNVISIITSCYNSEPYLHRYLDCILNQTNHSLQLILVNDGSTDRTEQIIADYLPVLTKKGVQVVYLKQQNAGIGAAYNLALPYVSGEFFTWCDSDNFLAPQYAETIINFFKAHQDAKILRHDGYFVPESVANSPDIFERTDFDKFSKDSPNPHKKNLFINAIIEKNWYFGNVVLDTAAFDAIAKREIYPSREGQNWQFCLPMLYHYEANYVPDPLFYFVMRDTSVSRQNLNNSDALLQQYDQYYDILTNVINSLNPQDKSDLLKIIDQKYITIKLQIAKNSGNAKLLAECQKQFDAKVAPNNLYQKVFDETD